MELCWLWYKYLEASVEIESKSRGFLINSGGSYIFEVSSQILCVDLTELKSAVVFV